MHARNWIDLGLRSLRVAVVDTSTARLLVLGCTVDLSRRMRAAGHALGFSAHDSNPTIMLKALDPSMDDAAIEALVVQDIDWASQFPDARTVRFDAAVHYRDMTRGPTQRLRRRTRFRMSAVM